MSFRGSYLANINLRHTAADAADSAVFAMHNPAASGVLLKIRRVNLALAFDGTAAADTTVGHYLIRFTVANPSTGTTVPRIKRNAAYAASIVADANIQQKSGILTMTSVSYESAPFYVARLPIAVTNGVRTIDLVDPIELRPDEGLAIRTAVAAVVGTSLHGAIAWDEKTL